MFTVLYLGKQYFCLEHEIHTVTECQCFTGFYNNIQEKIQMGPTNLVAGFKHQFNLVVSFFTIASLASIPWHFWAWLLYLFTHILIY